MMILSDSQKEMGTTVPLIAMLPEFGIRADFEFFIFGRPLFKVLSPFRISVSLPKKILQLYDLESENILSTSVKIE